MRILVVDDDMLICENVKSKLRRILKDRPLECDTANSVTEAQLSIQSHLPEIVITDLNMPGISGQTLVKYIKSNYPDIHVFVLSGYDDYQLVRQAFLNGAEDYLLKPMAIEELQEKVLKNLSLQKESPETPSPDFQMESALRFIEDNLSRELSMDEVASNIAMSYNYFSRRFREHTGYGFPEYVNLRRIEHSKSYLRDPSLKIFEIAYKLGYSSASAFSRVFKKYEGCYPAEFRHLNGITKCDQT